MFDGKIVPSRTTTAPEDETIMSQATETSTKKVSRRDAIKILTAVAGATALANTPTRWSKPELKVGVLPVHAQTSLAAPHFLRAGGAQDANMCQPVNLISTVTITPPDSGVLMVYTITADPGITINSPASLTGNKLTDGTGVATLTINATDTAGSGGNVTVNWGFAKPSSGAGTSSQVFTTRGC